MYSQIMYNQGIVRDVHNYVQSNHVQQDCIVSGVHNYVQNHVNHRRD